MKILMPGKVTGKELKLPVFASINIGPPQGGDMIVHEATLRNSLCTAIEAYTKATALGALATLSVQTALLSVQAPTLGHNLDRKSVVYLKLSTYQCLYFTFLVSCLDGEGR
jgi:hypothetical protein